MEKESNDNSYKDIDFTNVDRHFLPDKKEIECLVTQQRPSTTDNSDPE